MPRPKLWTPDPDVCPYELANEHLLDPGITTRLPGNTCRALPGTYQEHEGGPRIIIPGVYLCIPLRHVAHMSQLPKGWLSLVEELALTLPEAAGMRGNLVATVSINCGDVTSGLRLAGHLHTWVDFRMGEVGKPSQYLGAVGVKRKLNQGSQRQP